MRAVQGGSSPSGVLPRASRAQSLSRSTAPASKPPKVEDDGHHGVAKAHRARVLGVSGLAATNGGAPLDAAPELRRCVCEGQRSPPPLMILLQTQHSLLRASHWVSRRCTTCDSVGRSVVGSLHEPPTYGANGHQRPCTLAHAHTTCTHARTESSHGGI